MFQWKKKVLFVDTCIIEKKTLWVNILVDIESSSFVFFVNQMNVPLILSQLIASVMKVVVNTVMEHEMPVEI